MSSSRDPTEATLTIVTLHLGAAEMALAGADPSESVTACQAALADLRLATVAHDRHVHGVSHDLRNTLTSISGQAQLLERSLAKDTLTPERIRQALQRIEQSVTEAAAILRRLSEQ